MTSEILAGVRTGLVLSLESLSPRRRRLRRIRAVWGRPGDKDGWLADRYFRLAQAQDGLSHVDERTWNDLEFPRIFAILDTTITRPGSQYLFRMLRTYAQDSQRTDALHGSFQTLRRDRDLRERIQLILATLDSDSAATIIDSLFERRLEGPKHPRLTVIWSLACIGSFAAMAASVMPLALLIPILTVNFVMVARTGSRRYRLVETLRAMERMVRVADRLWPMCADRSLDQLTAPAAARTACARARGALRLFAVVNLSSAVGAWLNLLFLAEPLASLYTIDRVSAVRPELRAAYELVGSLDATIAAASFVERTGTWCRAVIGPGRLIEIEAGYHPLLAAAVPNSLMLRGHSALISGSNMAGKTTFVKTMAINMILGRTVGICLAVKATIPPSPVMACIRSEQSVESGKSRYFSEIEAILSFLRRGTDSPVVVLDEPFSGTNTTERIAAAKSVLGALNVHSLVLATTHDVELQDLLRDRFDMYHFTERPELDGFFDYRLQTGPCTEGNALRLLARVGFPPEVIREAAAFVAERTGTIQADAD